MSQAQSEEAILESEVVPPYTGIERRVEHIESRIAGLEAKVEAHDATIDAVLAALPRLEDEVSKFSQAYELLRAIGEWKRLHCKHHHNGVCRAWRLRSDNSIPAVKGEDGVLRPRVDRAPILCALCPLYEPTR